MSEVKTKSTEQVLKEAVELLDFAENLKKRYSSHWIFVKNMHWDDAGLSINIGDDTTIVDIAEGIVNHERVVGFLKSHCHEEDADEKYYYPDGHVKYYQVLDLALEAEPAIAC